MYLPGQVAPGIIAAPPVQASGLNCSAFLGPAMFIQFHSFSISWKCVFASMFDSQVLEAKAEVKIKASELAAEDGVCGSQNKVSLFMKCAMSNLNNATSWDIQKQLLHKRSRIFENKDKL
jgi:hypothetical protein